MKILLCLLAFAAIANPLHAIPVVTISGTIFTEREFEPGRYSIKTTSMNANAIYEAFGVSAKDYVLDCDPGSTNFLVLRPRTAKSGLSPIVILQNLDSIRYLREWRSGPFRHEMQLSSPVTAAPLFNAFRGTAVARVGGHPSPSGGGTFRVHYEAMGSSSTHILKFRFTAEGSGRPGG